jgi:hypothetical protein
MELGGRVVASDARSENTTSQIAHRALGFIEVERAVLYRNSSEQVGEKAALAPLG